MSQADGYGERSAAQAMVFDRPSSHQKTIGADKGKGYDMRGYSKSINARRGTEKVGAAFGLHVIAYNLIRLGNLLKPAIAASRTACCPVVWPSDSLQKVQKCRKRRNQPF